LSPLTIEREKRRRNYTSITHTEYIKKREKEERERERRSGKKSTRREGWDL